MGDAEYGNFANQVNEAVTDFLACKISGEKPRHYIEGNKNDAVSYRTIKVNDKYIRGYCLPNYASKATKADFNIEIAEYYDKKLFGKYKTKADLNLRTGAGTSKEIITTMNRDSEVFVTGCYNLYNNVKWYLCFYNKEKAMYGGYASSNYLKKI